MGRATRRIARKWRGPVLLVVIAYTGWCGMLFFLQERMIFVGAGRCLEGATAPRGAESIWHDDSEGSRVEGWYFAPRHGSPALAPLVVFTHGNAERIDDCIDIARGYLARGYAVLLPEYPGYGRSGGRPGERSIVSSCLTLIKAAAERPGVDPARVILHGRSLGGAVAAQVALRLHEQTEGRMKPAALIMQSTFTSVPDMARGMFIPSFCIRHQFRTDRAVKKLTCPVLIMHGKDDEIVPSSHGRALHAAAPGSTHLEMPGHHNDFPVDEERYWVEIDGFLGRAGLKRE